MKKSLAALAAIGAIIGSLPPGVQVVAADPVAQKSTVSKSNTGDTQRSAPSDTKIDRLGTGYARRQRAPVGKRYRASVRQHQRHAAKARRRSAAR